jgi:energy-coupling factor transport system substrate-specific component
MYSILKFGLLQSHLIRYKMNTTSNSQKGRMLALTFIPLAIAINVGIGAIVKILNLPIYMDSIGTIIATLLLGWRSGAIVGILGFVITSIFINPFAIYFIGTQAVIAIVIDFIGKRGWFSNVWKVILSGIGLGITTAIVSAPVIILVFQGATGNGAALVTSFFAKMGNQIVNSVFLSGFSIEPIDKLIQCLLAFFILKSIPKSLLERFNSTVLRKNKFIS